MTRQSQDLKAAIEIWDQKQVNLLEPGCFEAMELIVQAAKRYLILQGHAHSDSPRMDNMWCFRMRHFPGRWHSFDEAVDALARKA